MGENLLAKICEISMFCVLETGDILAQLIQLSVYVTHLVTKADI